MSRTSKSKKTPWKPLAATLIIIVLVGLGIVMVQHALIPQTTCITGTTSKFPLAINPDGEDEGLLPSKIVQAASPTSHYTECIVTTLRDWDSSHLYVAFMNIVPADLEQSDGLSCQTEMDYPIAIPKLPFKNATNLYHEGCDDLAAMRSNIPNLQTSYDFIVGRIDSMPIIVLQGLVKANQQLPTRF